MPPGPSATASTSRGPGREVKTTSLACATALGVSAHTAPSARCGLASSWRGGGNTMGCPAFKTLRAIGSPMLPRPMKPIPMCVSSPLFRLSADDPVPDVVLRYTNGGPVVGLDRSVYYAPLSIVRRPRVRRFELVLPESLDDCVKALVRHGSEAKLLAGGTDLLPQMKNALLKPAVVIDLSGVSRLRAIESGNGQGLRVGAAVTARALELDRAGRSRFLSLPEGGALVGSGQVRTLATLGGNLCNAAPSADMAPPLLALDAEAVITGPKGER